MPNDFLGELPKARLLDLVKPLLSRKNSGMVLVRGTQTGELHLEGGNIIHATNGSASGDEAVLAMMDWDKGRVIFDWESTTEERTVHTPTEQLLQRWTEREGEWKKIREVIPSFDVAFRIHVDRTGEDRQIPGDQWRVLTLCNGTRPLPDVADALGWDVFKVSKTICQMVQTGLLEQVEGGPSFRKTMNEDFFLLIETELKKAIGPIAPIIVDDMIAEFGESRDAFPEDRVQAFVKAIGQEIVEDAKRDEFAIGMAVSLIENGYKL
jgi:coenzyme F420-reducing hydrogenase delta subunit